MGVVKLQKLCKHSFSTKGCVYVWVSAVGPINNRGEYQGHKRFAPIFLGLTKIICRVVLCMYHFVRQV